ncbi:hypothetical protein O3M35_011747 [Rhynocoris fuscipes]|uniref:Uncharacterized protein n=1 Tax=Rhynocoris fuscipes TaxID=488301 RepID=A0AAW1D3J5_9HEMI
MVNLKVPVVKKFCFCIPLEIGAKIFAFIHLIFSGLVLGFIYYLQIKYFSSDTAYPTVEIIEFMLQLSDVGVTLQIVFGVYLVIGLYERNPVFLLSWMMFEISSIIIGFYIVILELYFGLNHSWRLSLVSEMIGGTSTAFEEIQFIVFYSFFCLMIYSVYKKFSRERDDKGVPIKWSRRDPNNVY